MPASCAHEALLLMVYDKIIGEEYVRKYRCNMNASIEAAVLIARWENRCTDILAEKVASQTCWFNCIHISVENGSRRVPGKHLVPQKKSEGES
jgi:hypothetical protein